jgi:uncharacterized protein DUF5682
VVADQFSAAELNQFGASLIGDRVIYFPVRHHSPACAFHLRKLIAERRPSHVLIEGPAAFDPFVDLLASPAAKPPLALYASCGERVTDPDAAATADGRRRRGAYYPMCDYSPEWVALREGKRIAADVHFIDLDFHKQISIDQTDRLSGRISTLLGERHFQRSAYLRRLAQDRGCRNHDELWDRLFEAWHADIATETFIAQVATYCRLARADVTAAEHERDGTLLREAEMAWHVAQALRRIGRAGGPILVVTGGYHTVALPALVKTRPARPTIDVSRIVDPHSVLIRYSFDRLDRLTGYGAGMPSPAFYQRLWEAVPHRGAGRATVALDLLSDIASRARASGVDQAPTAATVIAAYEHVQRLAQLRDNPTPTRDDVLDAIVSCYVKGATDAEGRTILELALALMSGSAVGEVPPEAGLPPIVDDFYARAKQLRLKVSDSEGKKLALDVYRDSADRDRSRFLHVLGFLDVPFATCLAGPQFTGQTAGRRLHEHWDHAWSPQVEAALIDAASFGNSLREAATNKFLDELRGAEDEGRNRSAASAVAQLSRACLFGLHELADRILTWLRHCVREDPSVPSAAAGLSGLVMLWESREPLGADGLAAVPGLARTCCERACYLIGEAASSPDQEAVLIASALIEIRSCITGQLVAWFDPELFWSAVVRLAGSEQRCHPTIAGAAAGVLYSAGRWSDDELCRTLRGRIVGRSSPQAAAAFFHGVTLAAREALWQSETLLATLRDIIEDTEEREFITLLPDLRLAFSRLTPRETDHLGERVAAALGAGSLGPMVSYGVGETEVQRNLGLSLQLRDVLARDGLAGWLAGASTEGEGP